MKKITCWGFILFVLGMSMADSASLIPTIICCTAGMILASVGVHYYEEN